MRIAMYLGGSKYWWAYLALQSNLALQEQIFGRREELRQAVVFDDPARLPRELNTAPASTKFFYVLWDGIVGAPELREVAALLPDHKDVTLLTVGDLLRIPSCDYIAQPFFPVGTMQFLKEDLPWDSRTRMVLALCRARNALMPLKNLREAGLSDGMALLTGARRLVFCGSYGLAPETLRQLCERHQVNVDPFRSFPFFTGSATVAPASYLAYLEHAGSFLTQRFREGTIDRSFLFSATHLLGREYALTKMHQRGMPIYTNSYAGGANVNVYTTPWYRQHIFPDFGSAVGQGNYPRLADLLYFRKHMVQLDMIGDLEALAAAARDRSLPKYFEQRWSPSQGALESALAGTSSS